MTPVWEEMVQESRPWWLRLLSWSSRFNVVCLMGAAKTLLAIARRFTASEFGTSVARGRLGGVVGT